MGSEVRSPTLVEGSRSYSSVAVGRTATCGIDDGDLYCWGSNARGALGIGTLDDLVHASPTRVSDLPGRVVAVEAGWSFFCALVEGGVPYCWGQGSRGRLGVGDAQAGSVCASTDAGDPLYCVSTPSRVQTEERLTHLALGARHACGRSEEGPVLCWGWNGNGQLGNGSPEDASIPREVAGFVGLAPNAMGRSTLNGSSRAVPPGCGWFHDDGCR